MNNYDEAPPLYKVSYLYIYIYIIVKFRLVINSRIICKSRLFAYEGQCSQKCELRKVQL